ncbi:PKD domain-containing protein [Flammeovirga sp. SJP92]|uniref:PKD domain-containing protein n=1 Tax=Flammeovirga sp. SJP92 TaxID=1775430 RepID=UPI0007892221|nr:PKD domain-containing protein [Flammeovirga sp. SJP92]KXX66492.1 hypothetical protein AVL50_31695 [Flammeovirga sp. SJP92]
MKFEMNEVRSILKWLIMIVSLYGIGTGNSYAQNPNVPRGIVYAQDTVFLRNTSNGNAEPYYFSGTNNYYMMYKSMDMAKDILDGMVCLNQKVVRMWFFMDGAKLHDGYNLQSDAYTYNEAGYVHLDSIMAELEKRDLKCIPVFVNYWSDFGGMQQYAQWTGGSANNFFTDPQMKDIYKEYVKSWVTRTNTVTGKKYADDPTIFSWQLTNEARSTSATVGAYVQWADEMSTYIKTLDPYHMVSMGDEGLFNYSYDEVNQINAEREANGQDLITNDWQYSGGQGDWEGLIQLPNIDFGTIHNYATDNWSKDLEWGKVWTAYHVEVAHGLNKPCIMEEYDKAYKGDWDLTKDLERAEVMKAYTDIIYETDMAGDCSWMLVGLNTAPSEPPTAGYTLNIGNDCETNVPVDEIWLYRVKWPGDGHQYSRFDPHTAPVLTAHGQRMLEKNIQAAPSSFNKLSPSDASSDVSVIPVFQWESAQYASNYTLTVSKSSDLTNPVVTVADISSVNYALPTANKLEYNTTYYWQVEAFNYIGSKISNTVYSFATQSPPPPLGVFTPSSPGTDEVSVENTVFSWSTADNATLYKLIVSPNSDLSNPIISEEALDQASFTSPVNLNYFSTYYWTVEAYNSLYSSTIEGGTQSFITQLPSPIVDNFESYASSSALQNTWIQNPNGGNVTITLDQSSALEGGQSMILQYDFNSYAGVSKTMNANLAGYDGLSFLVEGDNSGRTLLLQFQEASGEYWEASTTLGGSEELYLPFSAFANPSWGGQVNGVVEAGAITQMSFYFGGDAGSGTIKIDNLKGAITSGANRVPVANAGADQTVTDDDKDGFEEVVLNGSASFDADGSIASYVWLENGNEIANQVIDTVTLAEGTHEITLVVTDNDGATASDQMTVTVNKAGNSLPIANAGNDQTVYDTNGNGYATVTLDGSNSSDADGTIDSYTWIDAGVIIGEGPQITVDLPLGTTRIQLQVRDNEGASANDEVVIEVRSSSSSQNQNPVAVSTSPKVTDTDNNGVEVVTLDASESTDDGSIVSYVWSIDGIEFDTGAIVNKEFPVGTHNVTLTVTDDKGATGSTTVVVVVEAFNASRMDRVQVGNQSVFLSGGNLAWYNFANDFGEKTTNLAYYEQAISDFATRGGNSMRLWVHINGANNPELDANGYTSGLEPSMIQDLRDVLDIAYDHNVVLNLCLWSFDMLNTRDYPIEVSQRAKKLLEEESNIDAYINNALIPMVNGLKDHEALLSWEIFNEPEGMSNEFGWDFTDHVSMSTIQRFINRLSGAIHREDPNAKVTNGAWSFKANSDIFSGVEKNYYSDAELIAAGGDALGILDYYQVHYYSWAGTTYSPFVHPASHWELDKPLVIGEFYVEDQPGSVAEEDLFKILYNNGYAGAWGWQYRTYDDGDNTDEIHRDAMLAGIKTIDGYLDIAIDPNRNHKPVIVGKINSFRIDKNASTLAGYSDLNTVFNDPEGTALNFTVETSPANVVLPSVSNGMLSLAFANDATGEVKVTVTATDSGSPSASRAYDFIVSVNEPGTGNLALYQPVTASSVEEGANTAESVNDGDQLTRWSSLYEDPSWIAVAFDQEYSVNEVRLYWEGSYSSQYEIQVSQDGASWNTVYTNNAGVGGEDIITFPAVNARHIRMFGLQRALEWGHSIYEFEVYGDVPKSIAANAGPDQFLNDNDGDGVEIVTLDGTGSTDSEQTIVAYEWTENGVSIASGVTENVALTVGEHLITLTVTNDQGISSSDNVKVTILPAGCLSDATPLASNWSLGNEWSDQNNGSGLSNAGGALVLTHRMWGKTDIWLMQSGVPLTVTQGETVRLSFDFNSASTPAVTAMSVALISSHNNEGPVDIIQSGIEVTGPFETGFNTYNLDFTASQTSTEAYLAFYLTFASQPNQEVTYALKNLTVCTGTVSENTPPVANAGIDQQLTDSDQDGWETVVLDGTASTDAEGPIASYRWMLEGIEIATGSNPTVELSVGTHLITLIVTDADGLTATDEVTVVVEEAPLEASILEAESATLTAVTVVTDATASAGEYVHMQGEGTITWTFNAFTAGTQTIKIAYLLPHGNKNQYVDVNGTSLGSILFDGPTNTWLEKSIDVEVVAGSNTVTISKHWGYMYFDYISVGSGTNSRASSLESDTALENVSIYPNPATSVVTVDAKGFESMTIYDLKGVGLISSDQRTVQIGSLGTGLYLVKINTEYGVRNIRLSVR